jgi:hypothetical protein
VAATTVLLRPIQRSMNERLTEFRDHLLSQAEDYLGRRMTYGSMGPSLFGTLDIRAIQIYGTAGAPSDETTVLTIERLRVSYSLWQLMRGNISNMLRSIRLDQPVLTLDRKRDADLISLFTPPALTEDTVRSEQRTPITSLLPDRFNFRIRGGGGPPSGRECQPAYGRAQF